MIEKLHEKLIKGELKSSDLVKESIAKSKEFQDKYNMYVTLLDNVEDVEITDSLLSGIPYACKDNFSTAGILSTGSSNILKDYVPFFDATVIKKLKENNVVMIGKTVLDELAMGGTGTTGHTGIVRNPWDETRLIGGSSAGSAAAVALGVVPYALGSDTGDSIRKPAFYGGIVGFKPTYGLISRFGLFPFACSLDHVGCFTRSVRDAAIVTDAIKGKDERDMTSVDTKDSILEKLTGDIKGKKLFYIKEIVDKDNYKDDTDEELEAILDNFSEMVKKYEELGATVEGISFNKDLLKAIFPTYFTISCAEATSNNSNLTGLIFGPRAEGTKTSEMMFNARTQGFSELIKRRFVIGSYVLQKENQEKLFLNAQRIRRMIVDRMTELYKTYDAMILPGGGSVAPKFKSENLDKLSDRYLLLENHMAIANFGGFPSVTIPCGFVKNMPIGLSITGPIFKDGEVLNIAYALENTMDYVGQVAKEGK